MVDSTGIYDVAIVGAGPAGSSAAIRLSKAGFNVALIEQKQFPRQKLCGEFISPECLQHFAELGVLDEMSHAGGSRIERTVFYAGNGRSVTVPSEWFSPGTHALGLSRAEMDDLLLNRARTLGVNVLEETQATGVMVENETVVGVELRDPGRNRHEVHARLVIDATGRSRVLTRSITGDKGRRANNVAFKAHVKGAGVPKGDCEIYAYPGGYGGCSEVENDRHNLCFIVPASTAKEFGGDARLIMQRVAFRNKRAAASLSDVGIVGEWLAVPIENYGRASLVPARGLITVGDAAAFIDPFTGSGMLLALESSKIAAEAAASQFRSRKTDFSLDSLAADYRLRYAAAFDKRLRICSLLRKAAFAPLLADLMITGLSFSESLSRRLAKATRP